jgi:hypothetical protein
MSLQDLITKVETAGEHLKAEIEAVLAEAHAKIDALLAHEKAAVEKKEIEVTAVETTVAAGAETVEKTVETTATEVATEVTGA